MQERENRVVDAVIPTFRPDEKLFRLLDSLRKQSLAVAHVWIINTEDATTATLESNLRQRYGEWLTVKTIARHAFDHGASRNLGASLSSADYLLLMTQDAVPANEEMVASLFGAFSDPSVAVAYARQLPADDARLLERLAREFNYPSQSQTKRKSDLSRLGIKTYFCSNVCALYSKSIFGSLSHFPEKMIFNEDMIYASKAIESGYSICYQADAEVVHSHNYGSAKLFRRYFDLGVSQRQNRQLFDSVPSTKEGFRMVRFFLERLTRQGEWFELLRFFVQSVAKFCGYFLGKHYEVLPLGLCRKLSSFPAYWSSMERKNGN